MKNVELIMCVAFIAFHVGLAAASVGKMSEMSEPFPWYLPLLVFGVTGTPAVLGYLAGRRND